jgi:hypothetical protein
MIRSFRAAILIALIFNAKDAFAATTHYISKSLGADTKQRGSTERVFGRAARKGDGAMRGLFRLLLVLFLFSPALRAACPSGNQTIDPLGNPIPIANVGVTGTITGSITSCFFVSKATGADTNTGLDENNAWAHLPGMPSCTNTCASHTPAPGEGFILRGGDAWVSSDLPLSWPQNGTSTNPIYIGVDKNWFNASCGGSWCRPIFNATGSNGSILSFVNRSWVIADNIEITGMNNSQSGCRMTGGSNVRCTQLYFHAWTHTGTTNNVGFFTQCGAGSMVDHNVADGSDSTKNTMNGVFITCAGTVQYNYFNFMVSGILGSVDNVNNNIVENAVNSADGDHCNGFFTFGPASGTVLYFYNNIERGMSCAGGVNVWITGNSTCAGCTAWVYNNIVEPSAASGNTVNIGGHATFGDTGTYHVYNNVVSALNGGTCFGNGATPPRSITNFGNNHCINTSKICDNTGTTCVDKGGNLGQSLAVANGQGYTNTETEWYSPANTCTPGPCSTLRAGINQTSLCTGNVTALCRAITYPAYNSTNHTMGISNVAPAGTPRGSTWDVGSYQFSGSGAQAPQPPTGLLATVQ